MWDRRKIGAIGFHHKGVCRNRGGDFLHLGGVFESDDAGKGNHVAEIQELPGPGQRFAEAMEDSAELSGVAIEYGDGVIPGVALMYDGVQAEFDREGELLLKKIRLCHLQRTILFVGFRDVSLFPQGHTGQTMIIQAGFSDGHDARMAGEFAQIRNGVAIRFVHGIWMHANDRVDIGMLLGDRDCPATAFDRGPDGHDPPDARFFGTGQDAGEVCGKIGEIQVSMGIGQHRFTIHEGRNSSNHNPAGMVPALCSAVALRAFDR